MWKKSQASIVDACVRRNCRHVESVCRRGAGGIRSVLTTRRIVEVPTPVAELEQFTPDPLISLAAVLHREALNQRDGFGADRRPTRARRVSPLPDHQAPASAQDGAWSDQAMRAQFPGH